MNFKQVIQILYIGGLVLLPIVLLILPADHFDHGQSFCLSVLLLDTQCYGCGMTRAIQHMIHIDLEAAYQFNKIAFLVLPVLVYLWFNEIRSVYRQFSN